MKKAPTPPKKKQSLMQRTGSRDAASSPFPRSLYKGQFDKMVKGGMSAREAAKAIKKIMQDDMLREMQEFNS